MRHCRDRSRSACTAPQRPCWSSISRCPTYWHGNALPLESWLHIPLSERCSPTSYEEFCCTSWIDMISVQHSFGSNRTRL
ncbi:unnamed protein product [Protopolystoma xenopodis]|uniref:Uncharacterized protein n=1 Tax=Protopolystoma xenopodis TaxID=117903 RepID=A0A3S5AWH4_9PLAT|nr:unnamed protein product [Protopolystoma xenopodis]